LIVIFRQETVICSLKRKAERLAGALGTLLVEDMVTVISNGQTGSLSLARQIDLANE
jgi:hypothetical protein